LTRARLATHRRCDRSRGERVIARHVRSHRPAGRLLRLIAAGSLVTPAAGAAIAAPAAPPPAFARCAGCHSARPGETRLGPSLFGVTGRNAGSAPGFPYSAAMKSSGLAWKGGTLDAFLAAPAHIVPGTTMAFAGITDKAERAAVIAYLATLR
jgi:cytochrome c